MTALPTVAAMRQLWSRPQVRQARRLGAELFAHAKGDRITGLAAEVAFFVVLSVFPALLVMTAMLGFLDSIVGRDLAQQAQQRVVEFLQRVLTQEAAGTIEVVRELFTEQRTGLLTFSAAAGVWATGRGFASVIRALNVAYDVVEDRSWFRRQAIAVVLSLGTVAMTAVMVAMIVVGPLLGAGGTVADVLGVGSLFATAWDWLRVPAVIVALVAWSATVYHVGPRHAGGGWRDDMAGAGLTALWWLLTAFGFRFGLAALSQGNRVFGVLGGPLILMGLIYVLALGLLVGGELNAVLLRARRDEP